MDEKTFQFAIEDGSLINVKYNPAIHRLDKNVAKNKVASFLQTYGQAGKKVEIYDTDISGEYRIEIEDALGHISEIYAGISNLQTGGNTRPIDEFRIQMPGVIYNDLYLKKQAGKTAVLFGVYYWNSEEMYPALNTGYSGQYIVCAWEPTQTNSVSPLSKQIKVQTIAKAIKTGFAQYKGGVIACAFRPELIYFYLDNYTWITKGDVKDLPADEEPEEVLEPYEDNSEYANNILLYGVPGSGKSHYIKANYPLNAETMERVVFHPDYTYSDFVGQILPRVEDDKLRYVFTPGPFTKILKKAISYPDRTYYLIIEEINRGNAPAIFGEIFQLLDRNAIGESEYGITNFDIANDVYGTSDHQIKIPGNLWILATMNTSDQNVFTLDTAFQRRWLMKHIDNNVMKAIHSNAKIDGSKVTWGVFASVINEQILKANEGIVSSEDKRLGAYFALATDLDADRFSEKVLKYLWDDAFRMDRDYIFADGLNSLDMVIDSFKHANGDRLGTVLRANIYSEMLKTLLPDVSDETSEENE